MSVLQKCGSNHARNNLYAGVRSSSTLNDKLKGASIVKLNFTHGLCHVVRYSLVDLSKASLS